MVASASFSEKEDRIMAKSNTIELDRRAPKAASLRPFRPEDEVLIIAGSYEDERAKVWYPGLEPGTFTVFIPRRGVVAYDIDEDHMIHARR